MNTKEIDFDNLSGKKFVRFHTITGGVDFLGHSISAQVYNSDTNEFISSFDVTKIIIENKQSQTDVFDFKIPKNITSLKFKFESVDFSVNLILGTAKLSEFSI